MMKRSDEMSKFDSIFKETKAVYETRIEELQTERDNKVAALPENLNTTERAAELRKIDAEYLAASDEAYAEWEAAKAEALKDDPLRKLRMKSFGK